MTAMTCPSCGSAVNPGDIICPTCLANLTRAVTTVTGARRAPEPTASAAPAAPAAPASATRRELAAHSLRLRFGTPDSGAVTVARGDSLVLGRDPVASPASSLLTPFDNVSRRHALVGVNADGTAWIEDLGSTNGTYVNGRPVPPKTRARLRDGDQLRLGLAAEVTATVELLPREGPS